MSRARVYAKALMSLSDSGAAQKETFTKSFADLLKRKGDAGLMTSISREFSKLQEKKQRAKTVKVITAKELTDGEVDDILKKCLPNHGEFDTIVKKVDETLIGGFRIETTTNIIDISYKKSLQSMYRKMLQATK